MPGAWDYGLKGLAWALGELDPGFAPQWPGDLEQGLQVMMLGWQAYRSPNPAASEQMRLITRYVRRTAGLCGRC